jgi:hypothetical protein
MIKTEAGDEQDDHANDFGPWVDTVKPGIFIKVEEDVHRKVVNANLTMQNEHYKIEFSGDGFAVSCLSQAGTPRTTLSLIRLDCFSSKLIALALSLNLSLSLVLLIPSPSLQS